MGSSRKVKAAMRTVKIGTVAVSTDAIPEGSRVWPKTMRENGIRLLIADMPPRTASERASRGIRSPSQAITPSSMAAAIETRASTTVKTGTSFTATAMKR